MRLFVINLLTSLCLVVALIALFPSISHAEDIYKCKVNGAFVIQNIPCDPSAKPLPKSVDNRMDTLKANDHEIQMLRQWLATRNDPPQQQFYVLNRHGADSSNKSRCDQLAAHQRQLDVDLRRSQSYQFSAQIRQQHQQVSAEYNQLGCRYLQ